MLAEDPIEPPHFARDIPAIGWEAHLEAALDSPAFSTTGREFVGSSWAHPSDASDEPLEVGVGNVTEGALETGLVGDMMDIPPTKEHEDPSAAELRTVTEIQFEGATNEDPEAVMLVHWGRNL